MIPIGLLNQKVKVTWNRRSKSWYVNRGFTFTRMNDVFEVMVEDLPEKSNFSVEVECDNCNKKLTIPWNNFNKCVRDNGDYFCSKCSINLFRYDNTMKKFLENRLSFEQWCINNHREDVLLRWNYKLNKIRPSEVTYGTSRSFWFDCPRGIHKSEMKCINKFTVGQEGSIACNKCNSFAQWGIDNVHKDFLDLYWNTRENNKVKNDPWKISYSSKKKIWITCENKGYHDTYTTNCCDFIRGRRCPYCRGKSVHPIDSLGQYMLDHFSDEFVSDVWSNKNKKSPFEYFPKSDRFVYWTCKDGKHNDYKRMIRLSNNYDFRCPNCEFYKGESRIEDYLIKHCIKYIKNATSDHVGIQLEKLVGVGGRKLSYDFYLTSLNILIEHQGAQHEVPVNFGGIGDEIAKINLEIQKEHDKRKREFAKINNINLLEIWHFEFEKIEEILARKIQLC